MSKKSISGSCLCGEVAYEISGHMGIFQYCHCAQCRKFTGSAFASNLFVKPEQFKWTQGEELTQAYNPEDKKYFATCFCTKCGSSLPWFNQPGTVIIIPAGTLDETPDIKPIQNIFCASSADWYVDTSELPKHEKLPPKKH